MLDLLNVSPLRNVSPNLVVVVVVVVVKCSRSSRSSRSEDLGVAQRDPAPQEPDAGGLHVYYLYIVLYIYI